MWLVIKLTGVVIISMVLGLAQVTVGLASADYPTEYDGPLHPMDSITDRWGFKNRECTSFAAWRMERDGHPLSVHMKGPNGTTANFGNANTWDNEASRIGLPVTSSPSVGTIEQSDVISAGGHVAYVEGASSTPTVEDYNWTLDGTWHRHSWKASDAKYMYLGPPWPKTDVNSQYMGTNRPSSLDKSRLYAFVVDSRGYVEENRWNGAAWVWDEVGKPSPTVKATRILGSIYVGDNNPSDTTKSRLYVYVEGDNHDLYLAVWPGTNPWSITDYGPPAAGVTITDKVGTAYLGDHDVTGDMHESRLYLFVTASDHLLYDFSWVNVNGTMQWLWSPHDPPKGGDGSPIWVMGGFGAVYMGDNNPDGLSSSRLHAFVWGGDGGVWDQKWNGSSWVWDNMGFPISAHLYAKGVLGATYIGDNNAQNLANSRIYVYALSNDGSVYLGNWLGADPWIWVDYGPPPTGNIVVGVGTSYMGNNYVTDMNGSRMHCFVVTNDGELYDFTWQPGWIWGDQKYPNYPNPKVAAIGGVGTIYMGDNSTQNLNNSRFHIFVVGQDNHLWDDTWQGQPPGWVWGDQLTIP